MQAIADASTTQSSADDIANWARLLNDPYLERQAKAAEEVASLISRDPCPDDALLCGICKHEDALQGLQRIIATGDDESRQIACNLLFMLSMSEPDRPFDESCTAHVANRAIIGASPGLFASFVSGTLHLPNPDSPASHACNLYMRSMVSGYIQDARFERMRVLAMSMSKDCSANVEL